MSAEFQLVHLRDFEPVSAECLEGLPESLIRKQLIVPVARREGRLLVATPQTSGIVKPEGLQLLAHCPVDLVIAPVEEIIDFIRRHYPEKASQVTELTIILPAPAASSPAPAPAAASAPVEVAPPALPEPAPVASTPVAAPVPTPEPKPALVVNEMAGCPEPLRRLLSDAVANRAGEVLLEREGSRLRLRQRIRGVLVTDLREKISAPEAAEAFTYVLERGDSQAEGEVRWSQLHFESTLQGEPHGCTLVVSETTAFAMLTARLVPLREPAFDPVGWGMGPHQARTLETLLSRRQGVLLFSGFDTDDLTATMHGCLRQLVTPERHVIAVQGRQAQSIVFG